MGVPPARRAELPVLATMWSDRAEVATAGMAPAVREMIEARGGAPSVPDEATLAPGAGLTRLLYVVVVEAEQRQRTLATVRLAPSVRERGVAERF
ncbi:MAG: hypothetical protein AAF366_21180 [Pseudomonadota bacterium]